jgi:hypothetical protein
MPFYVYSTLTSTNNYAIYKPQPKDSKATPTIQKKISILGGSNVMPMPREGMLYPIGGLVTPRGTVTEVSDEDMELLEKDYHFNEHRKNGFIVVEKKELAPEKVVKNMTPKDGSAPKTPEDYIPSDKSEPGTPIYKEKDSKRK